MTSQATAIHMTIGAVAKTPKMSPNLRKSMMVCTQPSFVRRS